MNANDLLGIDRSDEPEMLDRPGQVPPEQILAAMPAFERLNRWTGAPRVLRRHAMPLIRRAAEAHAGRPVTVLDIGAGGGDLTRALAMACRRAKVKAQFAAIDVNRDLVAYAREHPGTPPEVSFRVEEIALHGGERQMYDVVCASHHVHRLDAERCIALLHVMGRLARFGFVVCDVVRHPLALAAARAVAPVLTRNPVFRHDAPHAIRRAYTLGEWAEIARRTVLPGITVVPHMPFRIAIVWERLVVTDEAPQPQRILAAEPATPMPA